MVVWRAHDPEPPAEVKAELHARLAAVVEQHFEFEHYVDDHMRNIPDHYHAHARPAAASSVTDCDAASRSDATHRASRPTSGGGTRCSAHLEARPGCSAVPWIAFRVLTPATR